MIVRNFMFLMSLLFLGACGDDLTIITPPPPENPDIVSFAVSPSAVTIAPGSFVQITASLVTAEGVIGSVTWASSNSDVATVDNNGRVDAVSTGTAVITATATAGEETSTAEIGLTVRPLVPAKISIQSITTGASTNPVNIGNVFGQIEINMNFDPGEEQVDSIAVLVNGEPSAKQVYASAPSAGLVSLSINTAKYTKNVQAGTATVDFSNGPATVSAAIYLVNGVTLATNTVQIVLNNTDGWAADLVKPTRTAVASNGNTYWGGPENDGLTTITVYPVIYSQNRSVKSIVFRAGNGCPNVGMTSLPYRTTIGDSSADVDCSSYEWTSGDRDNVAVLSALDNSSTPFTSLALISNNVVLGSTPDSIRFDWKSPSVSVPSINRTVPAINGWVNAGVNFTNFNSNDNGVGLRDDRDRKAYYAVNNCAGATAGEIVGGLGSGINGGIACQTNFIGGQVGITNNTAPWKAYGTESDRLGNLGKSGNTYAFGTDYTAPQIRWAAGTVDAEELFTANPSLTNERWNVDFIDDRAGFYNFGQPSGAGSAQRAALSVANHVNSAGLCLTGGSIGSTFVTNPSCPLVAVTGVGGPLGVDGWQAGKLTSVPNDEGYYGYRTNVTDAAGNTSATLFRNVVVSKRTPFSTGLGVPAVIDQSTMGFTVTGADSTEVVAYSLRMEYPGIPGSSIVLYSPQEVGNVFDDVITSPHVGIVSPSTGTPFAKRIETVTGTAWDGVSSPVPSNVNAVGLNPGNLNNVKPTSVRVRSFNPGALFGGVTPGLSSIIPIPGILVADGLDMADWNVVNPTIAVNHWRIIATTSTANIFNSTDALRAQAIAPTNAPNAPFVRVDFYRVGPLGAWNYLGSDHSAVPADQGTFRSWVWSMPVGSFVKRFDGVTQAYVNSGDVVIAVGVTATGEGLSSLATTMTP